MIALIHKTRWLRGILIVTCCSLFTVCTLYYHYYYTDNLHQLDSNYQFLFKQAFLSSKMILPDNMDGTHIKGKLLERVDVGWDNNVYFSVKTTAKFYEARLSVLMLTWFQTVNKNMLSIITEKSTATIPYANLARETGFNLIQTNCGSGHTHDDLCCKTGSEFAAYYETLEKNKDDEENLEWFCHLDDDMYVNIKMLSEVLQEYDPGMPYYIGTYNRHGVNHVIKSTTMQKLQNLKYPIKKKVYNHTPGAVYCISQSLMMELKPYVNGPAVFSKACGMTGADDVTVGLLIGIVLGHDLTFSKQMAHQYVSGLSEVSLEQLQQYATISRRGTRTKVLENYARSLSFPLSDDPKRFLTYHCLLYSYVSWCNDEDD